MKSMDIMKCKKYMYLTGRVLMGLFFVVAGILKLISPDVTAMSMEAAGIPMAGILVWVVIIFLIVAGGMMIAGRSLCCVGILLTLYVLLASLIFHLGKDQLGELLKNIAIMGGLLSLASSCMDKRCCGGVCAPKGDELDHEENHDHSGHDHDEYTN
jgi:putative oxidoreductase